MTRRQLSPEEIARREERQRRQLIYLRATGEIQKSTRNAEYTFCVALFLIALVVVFL